MEADKLPFFTANAPISQQLTARRLNQIVATIRANAIRKGVGYMYERSTGGTALTIKAGNGGGGQIYPFDLSLIDDSGTYKGIFTAGTVNGLLPSNYSSLTGIAKTGTVYIKLDVTLSNAAVQTAAFSVSNTIPPAFPTSMGVPPISVSILTHVVVDGAPFRVIGEGSIWLTPQQSFQTDKTTDISPGESPMDLWYTYKLDIV